jgi:transposase
MRTKAISGKERWRKYGQFRIESTIVIMDNASFHKSQDSQRLIKKVGCKVLFLPPYSPDLNPIEIFWANFKKMIQANLEKFKTLAEAIDFSFSTVDGCMQNKI